MPELPEVETIRRDLAVRISGRKITAVKTIDKKLGKADGFARFLIGKKIIKADRIGKLLIFYLSGGKFLLIHLKMTGQLILVLRSDGKGGYEAGKNVCAGGHSSGNRTLEEEAGGRLPNKHTRFVINFSGGRKLFFNDARRFGYVKIVTEKELAEIKKKYGIEPLQKNFTLENFKKVLRGKKVSVKTALLNQENISGIGNIYASEILFDAGVLPTRPAGKLEEPEIVRIFKAAKGIIAKAIKYRGTTFSDYCDSSGRKGNFSRFLKVYEREGEKCAHCGGIVKKAKIGGRSSYYCSRCQK